MGIRSSVGVPITVEGQLWGVMTVSSETDDRLPPDTEDRLSGLTDLAATAIANAEARDALRHVADEQTALRRVATLVARGVAPEVVLPRWRRKRPRLLPASTWLPSAAIHARGRSSSSGAGAASARQYG
jgi:GAF domain-containing protein